MAKRLNKKNNLPCSLRPQKSVRASKSMRPPKSLTGYNFMKSLFASVSKFFLITGLFCFSAYADYVQVKCTNHAGQVSFDKALLISYEYQLDNLLLYVDPRDEKFPEILKFLTTIPENKKHLNTRNQVRSHKGGCPAGVCQYAYVRLSFPLDQKPVKITRKAQFCANNATAIKLRKVLKELEDYSVED